MDRCLRTLEERCSTSGEFAYRPGGPSRPDATCWGILALQAAGGRRELVERAREALGRTQGSDGRVCISPQHKDACWPTALAVLAWHGSAPHAGHQGKAVRFLLDFRERPLPHNKSGMTAADYAATGWPWIMGTHSWVEPTAYTLLALRISGQGTHPRVQEAQQLLLDRQLPAGGWNYGSTVVFGRELRPMPEITGMALQAAAGVLARRQVEKSISYLRSQLPSLHTPFTAAWALLGLSAWQEQVPEAEELLTGVLREQEHDGPCDTVSLSLLVLARNCRHGLLDFLKSVSLQERKEQVW